MRDYAYTGGAHGRTTNESFVFAKDGQALSLAHVVSPHRREAFMRALKKKLRSIQGVQPEAISEVAFAGLDTFYLTDDAVVVMFSRYEVAPGAAGVITASVPRGDFVSIGDAGQP